MSVLLSKWPRDRNPITAEALTGGSTLHWRPTRRRSRQQAVRQLGSLSGHLKAGDPETKYRLVSCLSNTLTTRLDRDMLPDMWSPASALRVSREDREWLEALVRSGKTPQRVALRAHLVLRAAEGRPNHALAKELGSVGRRCCCGGSGTSKPAWPVCCGMPRGRGARSALGRRRWRPS